MRTELGPTLDEVLRSHRLPAGPKSPFDINDFEAFLEWREQALEDALAAVATGKGTPTEAIRSPERSSLDVQVEGVELELRRIIADTLAGESGALPSHVSDKINERIASARRRSPGHRKQPLRLTLWQARVLRPPRTPGRAYLQGALAAV